MATCRWLLLLPLLVEIVMAFGETDPPNPPRGKLPPGYYT